ncbi:MAG TPA: alpha/beta hydrolase [Acidimicrobiales bacterium]|nr:alpha/beta hydrolase [Acidimicrobiales bacterium]
MPEREPDRAGFVEVNRTRLRVWEWGDPTAPAVICAHGAHDHGRMWDGLAPLVAGRGFRVVVPDLRGFGDSGHNHSFNYWAAGALDLALLARGMDPPIGWIGHSYGARMVLYVGGVWPELARWVVSIDGLGPPNSVLDQGDPAEGARRGLDGAVRALTGPPRVYDSLEDMVRRRMQVNSRLPEEWARHLVLHGSVPAPDGGGGRVWKADPLYGLGLPGALSAERHNAENAMLRCPLLVLTGGEPDTWGELSPEEKEERLSHLPTARHLVVPGAGHYVHIEQPGSVMAAFDSFLADVAA